MTDRVDRRDRRDRKGRRDRRVWRVFYTREIGAKETRGENQKNWRDKEIKGDKADRKGRPTGRRR